MIYFKSQTLNRPTLDSTKRLSRLKAHEHYNGLSAYVLPRKQIGTLRLKRSTRFFIHSHSISPVCNIRNVQSTSKNLTDCSSRDVRSGNVTQEAVRDTNNRPRIQTLDLWVLTLTRIRHLWYQECHVTVSFLLVSIRSLASKSAPQKK